MNIWLTVLVAAFPALYLGNRLRQQAQHLHWKDLAFRTFLLTVLITCCLIFVFGIARDVLSQTLSPRYSGEVVDYNVTLRTPYVGYRGPATIPSYERIVQFTDEEGVTSKVATFMKVDEEPLPGTEVQFYVLGETAFEPSLERYLGAMLFLICLLAVTRGFYLISR